jgi:hypothetical protein
LMVRCPGGQPSWIGRFISIPSVPLIFTKSIEKKNLASDCLRQCESAKSLRQLLRRISAVFSVLERTAGSILQNLGVGLITRMALRLSTNVPDECSSCGRSAAETVTSSHNYSGPIGRNESPTLSSPADAIWPSDRFPQSYQTFIAKSSPQSLRTTCSAGYRPSPGLL